jgi:hypothetical protein
LRDISLSCAAVNIFLQQKLTADATPQASASLAKRRETIQWKLIFRYDEGFLEKRAEEELTPTCAVWDAFGEPVVEVGACRPDIWITTRPLRKEGRWACSTARL